MEFRNLKKQYEILKDKIDNRVIDVMGNAHYIGGPEVKELEKELADYVGVKHCITCGNGTDALYLVLRAWDIKKGDIVFVPDFTFFASAEAIAAVGATPYFIDVDERTFNIDPEKLVEAINMLKAEGKNAKACIAVDLYGLPCDYEKLENICKSNNLLLLEDAAQGFSGAIGNRMNCSFGDAATTSFFPAKPLGCYGDGGAVFTNDDEIAKMVRSYAVHGKGSDKYDNERIGVNSRLDTIQAAILLEKLKQLKEYEVEEIEKKVNRYNEGLKGIVTIPYIPENYKSGWAQYTITLENEEVRNGLSAHLKEKKIPTMVYYPKTMSDQKAFSELEKTKEKLQVSMDLTKRVLSLPLSPYIEDGEINEVVEAIKGYMNGRK